MTKLPFFIIAVLTFCITVPLAARAQDITIAAIMQRCTAGQECVAVPADCADSCGVRAVNSLYTEILDRSYRQLCGKAPDQSGQCSTASFHGSCVDNHCVLVEGAPVPASTETSSLPSSGPGLSKPVLEGDPAYTGDASTADTPAAEPFNEKDGKYTAYTLSPEEIKANILKEYGMQP